MFQPFIKALIIFQTSFYSLTLTKTDGSSIDVSSLKGKKVLIVNIATNSKRVDQLSELQQLQDQYKDSLVVIAFPSNSFGGESRLDLDIARFCASNHHTSFLIVQKGDVKGSGQQPVFHWLATKSENGTFDGDPSGDFTKYLISEEGMLVGEFASSVGPMDAQLTGAIKLRL